MTATSATRPVPIGGDVVGLRVCVVGDGLVAGFGDPRALGWVGRVSARTPRSTGPLDLFPLGVPGESTAGLVARWREETGRRLGDHPDSGRLVVGLGSHDLDAGLTLARSRLNLANVLDEAAARELPVLVVGPPPRLGPGAERLAELADAFSDVCRRRAVPFVDCYRPLVAHEDWVADLSAGGGVHPGQVGYGLIAWLVLHTHWHAWLGLPTP